MIWSLSTDRASRLTQAQADDTLHYPAVQPLQDTNIILGSADYPIYPQARTYSFGAQVLDLSNPIITGGMAKFVDPLPQFGSDIPIAVPDTRDLPWF